MKKITAAILALAITFPSGASAVMQIAAHTQASCAAGTVVATATGVANLTWYISGFYVDTIGATTGGSGSVTLTNLLGSPSNTLTFPLSWSGVGAGAATSISIQFPQPIPSTVGASVVLTVPNMSTGATNCSATIFGELR
jgi:hypothetical protein